MKKKPPARIWLPRGVGAEAIKCAYGAPVENDDVKYIRADCVKKMIEKAMRDFHAKSDWGTSDE